MNYRMLSTIALFIGAQASAATPTDQGWLCVADQAAGFTFIEHQDKWTAARFRADNKYIVRQVKPDDSGSSLSTSVWGVQRLGTLKGDHCGNFDIGFLDCETKFGRFRFNKTTLRFQVEQTFGYLAPYPPEGADTPNIEIGSCSPI